MNLTWIGNGKKANELWLRQMTQCAGLLEGLNLKAVVWKEGAASSWDPESLGELVIVDSRRSDLEEVLQAIPRSGRALIVAIDEGQGLPQAVETGLADDVLVHPFRTAEILAKLRLYRQVLRWDEVRELNQSFSGLIARLHEDLKLAERLQKARLPSRFGDLKGFQVKMRYLAGLRSGGEFFDLAEAASGERLSLLLTDSSSYGLSSAVLSVLMRVAAKLSGDSLRSSYQTVRTIYNELLLTLGENDQLSLFYGMISRKDLKLNYLNLGASRLYHSRARGPFTELGAQGAPISRSRGLGQPEDAQLALQPEDRLVLLSDGFVETVGGGKQALEVLNRFTGQDATDALNEFVYRVKSRLQSEEDMPEQDCTGVVLDVDAKFLRLAG